MNFLLDTCVISELAKPQPNKNVANWIAVQPEETLYLSILTFGELNKGIEKLPKSAKRDHLRDWMETDLKNRFQRRIIDINLEIAGIWGTIQAHAEEQGRPMPVIDSLIAATGICFDLTVVTRNVSDMEISGVKLLNLWA